MFWTLCACQDCIWYSCGDDGWRADDKLATSVWSWDDAYVKVKKARKEDEKMGHTFKYFIWTDRQMDHLRKLLRSSNYCHLSDMAGL